MRAAIIENGIVVNIIEVEDLDFMSGLVESDVACIGDLFADGAFDKPEQDPEATFADQVKAYDAIVQEHLDSVAASFGYGDPNRPEVSAILHAVGYADEPAVPKFQAEGRLLRAWRSRCWAACWPILDAVRAGERTVPPPPQLIEELDAAAPPPTAEDVATEIAAMV